MKNINPIEKVTFVFVFVFVTIGLVLAHVDHDYFREKYIVEDGIIEWLTVIGLVAGMTLCFYRVVILRSSKPALFLIMTALLGLLFLFGAGEEISWGQRVFKFESSEWFLTRNYQSEINVHNLLVKGKKLNRLIFSTGLGLAVLFYLFVLTPLYKRTKGFARIVDSLAIPVPQLHHVIACSALIFVVYVLVASPRKGELMEFGSSLFFALIVAFPYNKAAFQREG